MPIALIVFDADPTPVCISRLLFQRGDHGLQCRVSVTAGWAQEEGVSLSWISDRSTTTRNQSYKKNWCTGATQV